jgi:hypothetical protein
MKKTRILALPAIAAASLLALTGCFQLPPVGGNPSGNSSDPGTSEPAAAGEDVAGTSWTGEMEGFAELSFTLNPDGTVDISEWNGGSGFDSPRDTWSGDSADLTIVITQLQDPNSEDPAFDVTFNGTAQDGTMDLKGDAPDGEWTLSATQD